MSGAPFRLASLDAAHRGLTYTLASASPLLDALPASILFLPLAIVQTSRNSPFPVQVTADGAP